MDTLEMRLPVLSNSTVSSPSEISEEDKNNFGPQY